MQTRNNVLLTFGSNSGDTIRLTIPRADMSLTEARARATMEAMVDAATILTTAGFPTSVKTATIVSTARAPLVAGA